MSNKLKVLVLGITSNVGFKFYSEYKDKFNIYGTYRTPNSKIKFSDKFIKLSDLSKKELSKVINKIKPNIIINCIALGSLDQCEREKENCMRINFVLVKNLSSIIKNLKIKLVHFSSNAIYDGKKAPYNENSKRIPLNNYGKFKLKADEFIQNNLNNYLILRPITLIGFNESFQRDNPASFIIKKLLKNEKIKLVNDDFVNFLYLDDLVNILSILLQNKVNGIFNISGDETLNRYQLGLKIINKISTKGKLVECSSKELNISAKRGFNTSLINKKIKKLINYNFTPVDVAINKIIKKVRES